MKTKKGVITSAKMTGTVTVTIHRLAFHPVYKKRFRKSKKFLCDPNGMDLYPGDIVQIVECRPLSKRKRFRVTEILKAAPRVDEMKEDDALEKVLHREKKGADEASADAKPASRTGRPMADKNEAHSPKNK